MKNFILFFCSCLFLMSCSGEIGNLDESINPEDPNPDQPNEIVVSFGLSGEILDIIETPLMARSSQENFSDDLYGIQVYTKLNNEYSYYAYGVFDKIENLSIKLLEGYQYKFVCTMLEDGKNKILYSDYFEKYFTPFDNPLMNSFEYGNTHYLPLSLEYGSAMLSDGSIYSRAPINRYYGVTEDYIAAKNNKVVIDMKRGAFGAKFIAKGQNTGMIRITMEDAPTIYLDLEKNKEFQDIYSFTYMYNIMDEEANSVESGEAYTYSEDVDIEILWDRYKDGNYTPIVSRKIKFTRNKLVTVIFDISSDATDNNLELKYENKELEDGGTINL